MRSVLLAALAVLLAACVYEGKSKSADSDLAKAVRFVEIDNRNRLFDLSDTALDSQELLTATAEAVRVPDPRRVDLDSSIQVKIDRGKLLSGTPATLTEARSAELLAKKDRLLASIRSLTRAVELRALTVNAFAELARVKREGGDVDTARSAFRQQRRQFATAEGEAIDAILAEWEDDPVGFVRIDEAAKDESYVELQRVLQREVDEIEAQNAALEAEVNQRQIEMRLTAFLESGKQRAPIHLPGYDDLPRGQVQRRDRVGLDLSPEERARFDEQWNKTVAIAETAEDLRQGKKELREGLRALAVTIEPRLDAAFDAADELEQRVRAVDVRVFLDDTRRDLESLGRRIEAEATELGEDALRRARTIPRTWQARAVAAGEIHALVAEAAAIAESWKAARPPDLPDLVMRSATLASGLQRTLRTRVPEWFEQGAASFREIVEQELAELGADAIARVTALLDSEEVARIDARFDELRQIYASGKALFELLDDVLGDLDGRPPPAGELDVAHAFRLPVETIRDTTLDLTRTPRVPGDSVTFRAELFRTGESTPFQELDASFETEYFGWHGRLSPSVVLVQPTQLQGRDEEFAFAPVLSWMHGYRPRPEHTGVFDGIARAVDPAFGIHASFVNFDPDEQVEIGLGATISLWRDRLQFGAGANLMAARENDGRYYFFVGSDLISLLNSIGIGDSPP